MESSGNVVESFPAIYGKDNLCYNKTMKTFVMELPEGIPYAAELIRSGQIVAFPTETVYGLGADAFNERAVRKIFAAKGRPQDNPLIVHVGTKDQIPSVASEITPDAEKIFDAFLPGSLTVVLKKQPEIGDVVTAGLQTVGIRMPLSEEARQFLNACGVPIAAPSANTSGRPSPTAAEHVLQDLNGKIPCILKGKDCDVGIESTVLDLSRNEPLLLRPGIVTAEEIEEVLGKRIVIPNKFDRTMNSPGIRYRHYAPEIPVWLNTDGDSEKIREKFARLEGRRAVLCLEKTADKLKGLPCISLGKNAREGARNIFSLLRKCEKEYDVLIAVWDDRSPIGNSVLNRLKKTAGGKEF